MEKTSVCPKCGSKDIGGRRGFIHKSDGLERNVIIHICKECGYMELYNEETILRKGRAPGIPEQHPANEPHRRTIQ